MRASKARTGHRTGQTVSQALERVRRAARSAFRRHPPKAGAVCRNPARTDLSGGRSAMAVPTALHVEFFAFYPKPTQGSCEVSSGLLRIEAFRFADRCRFG